MFNRTPLELAKMLRAGKQLSSFGDILYLENGNIIESRWENVPDNPTVILVRKTWKQILRELRSGKWY